MTSNYPEDAPSPQPTVAPGPVQQLAEADDTSNNSIVDRAMWKYVLAWFWTGVFATNAGIAFTFISYRDYTRWGALVLLPALLYAIGAVAALLSLSSLIRYLRFLTRSLWALLFAIGARFAISIVEVLFSLTK